MITQEHEYYLRFILLLIQGGTEVLRCLADKALQKNSQTLDQFLLSNKNALQNAKNLSKSQKVKLFPASPNVAANVEDFDITLLSYLITKYLNGCLVSNELNAVITIREIRNNYSAHAPEAKMTLQTFQKEWTKLIRIIVTVSNGLPEEKQNKLNDLINSIENETLDIKVVIEEIKKLDTSNDFNKYIVERLEQLTASQCESNKVMSEMQLSLQLILKKMYKCTTTILTPRGEIQLGADDLATVSYGQSLLLQALKDSITHSSSQEHNELKEEVDNFVEDIKQLDISLENVSEGSIILEFQCFSFTAVLNLIEYFNSSNGKARFAKIAKALENAVGKKINISGTIDIQSFKDVIQKTQQIEQDKFVRFEMACNCIGDLLQAFNIVEERTVTDSLIESATLLPESVGKPVTLKTSIDIGQIQKVINSIKKFLDMDLTKDADSDIATLVSDPTETLIGEQRDEIDVKCSKENDDVEDKFKSQNAITSDMKLSEDIASSLKTTSVRISDQVDGNSEMTADRRKRKFSETLEQGSDELHEFRCLTCAEDEKRSNAVSYCVDCDKNFCSLCIKLHNRFIGENKHHISDFLSCEVRGERQSLLVQKCDKHAGKLINVYCSGHDVVLCAACVAYDHRFCQGKRYIRDIANRVQPNKEITEMESDAKDVLVRLDQLKHQQQDCIKHLHVEKENILTDFVNLRRRTNDKLHKMEKTLMDDIDSKIQSKAQPVNESIDIIETMKSSIENIPKTLKSARSTSNAELFVQLNIVKSRLKAHKFTMEEIFRTAVDAQMLKLVPSQEIQKFVTSDNVTFGHIAKTIVPKSTKHIGDFNFHLDSDDKPGLIHDSCLTKTGNIILVDFNNKRVKKLDQSYVVTEHVDVPDNPGYVCEIDNNQLVVTLHYHKKVQFVFQQPLKLGNSFSAGATCRGIDCYNAKLYICCGGYEQDNEGPAHIKVYTLNGDLLKTFYEGLTLPLYIKVSDETFISEFGKKKLRSADMFDFRLSEMEISVLNVPKGICRIGDDQLCIAGHVSNNIVLISQDGSDEQELLTEADGIVRPFTVCFDEKRSHLIVPLGGPDVIKVFKVEI